VSRTQPVVVVVVAVVAEVVRSRVEGKRRFGENAIGIYNIQRPVAVGK